MPNSIQTTDKYYVGSADLAGLYLGSTPLWQTALATPTPTPPPAGGGPRVLTRNATTGALNIDGVRANLAATNFYDAVVTDNAPTSGNGVATVLPRTAVTAGLEAVVATGHNCVRIHSLLINQDKPGTAHPSPTVWTESVMVAADFVLSECARLGLLVIAPAGDRWAFYHGGFASYADVRGKGGLNGFLTNQGGVQDDWFTNHLDVMLRRTNTITGRKWYEEIQILESGNEVYDQTFASFHTRFTAYVKALPSGSRITADGSAASGNFPRDWALNDANTDIVGTHLYDDQRLNGARVRDQAAISNAKGKAYVVGEYDWRNNAQPGSDAGGTISGGATRAQFLDDLRRYAQGAAWWSVITTATSGHNDGYQLLLTAPQNAEQTAMKNDITAFNAAFKANTQPSGSGGGGNATDFNDTFDGSGALDTAKWSVANATAGASAERVNGQMRLRLGTLGNFGDNVVVASKAPVSTQRTLSGKITPDGKGQASESYLRVHIRTPNLTNPDSGDRYYFQLQSWDGAWGFFKKIGNTETILSGGGNGWTVLPGWAAGAAISYEVITNGASFEVRVWTGNTRPATAGWASTNETSVTTPGYVGVSLGGGTPARAATWLLDDWSVGSA